MREIFTYGSVGGALGNQCFYPEMFNAKDEHQILNGGKKITKQAYHLREKLLKKPDILSQLRRDF